MMTWELPDRSQYADFAGQESATSAEEKARYVDELNGMALRMVTSLDEIVWRSIRATTPCLAGRYFGAYAQRLMELASVACGLDVAEDLPIIRSTPSFGRNYF